MTKYTPLSRSVESPTMAATTAPSAAAISSTSGQGKISPSTATV